MEKRFFHFFFIVFLFLLVWSFIFPSQPEQAADQPPALAQSGETTTTVPPPVSSDPLSDLLKDDVGETLLIGDYYVTYSPLGGYVKKVVVDDNKDPLVYRNIGLIPDQGTIVFSVRLEGNKILFTSPAGDTKEFVFGKDTIEINLPPALRSTMIAFSGHTIDHPIDQRYQEVFYRDSVKGGVQRQYFTSRFFGLFGKGASEDIRKGAAFVGARDRYYCAVVLGGDHTFHWAKVENKLSEKKQQTKQLRLDLYLHDPQESTSLYIGPQRNENLQAYDLQWVIYYGMFHGISTLMIKILYFFFSFTKSWGLSIILFSASIYFALLPFTAKSMKAMKKMQQMQPEIEALKAKFKDNPQKLQKETIEFYKKHKINPVSGCLPLFFQMPVFLAMYQVIFRLYDLKGASFLWIQDLSLPDRLYQLPFTIPVLNTDYFNLLPILVMILGLIQQKITTSSATNAPSQQKTMGLFMTVFIGFIFYTFPAALVLYWFTQNIFTLLYQIHISRSKFSPQN
jgi:YidC/Oxa1 family membrane protein insertase